jgi:7-cyano-7-deazaguanine reductase
MQSSYEGLQSNLPSLELPELEAWIFQHPGSNTQIKMENPEFTCICPKTGLPDFANIIIEYQPNELCIELKSLKLYMAAFRNIGIFHEHVVNRILADVSTVVKPVSMKVTGVFNNRGGIYTTVSAQM